MELRCPRELDPRPSWTLGDVLTELDALQATRRAAPPTPLKQPPEWYIFHLSRSLRLFDLRRHLTVHFLGFIQG
jgi:hypothetical protein